MAYYHGIVCVWRKLAISLVGEGDIVECYATLEKKFRYNGDILAWYKIDEGIFWLAFDSF